MLKRLNARKYIRLYDSISFGKVPRSGKLIKRFMRLYLPSFDFEYNHEDYQMLLMMKVWFRSLNYHELVIVVIYHVFQYHVTDFPLMILYKNVPNPQKWMITIKWNVLHTGLFNDSFFDDNLHRGWSWRGLEKHT